MKIRGSNTVLYFYSVPFIPTPLFFGGSADPGDDLLDIIRTRQILKFDTDFHQDKIRTHVHRAYFVNSLDLVKALQQTTNVIDQAYISALPIKKPLVSNASQIAVPHKIKSITMEATLRTLE